MKKYNMTRDSASSRRSSYSTNKNQKNPTNIKDREFYIPEVTSENEEK